MKMPIQCLITMLIVMLFLMLITLQMLWRQMPLCNWRENEVLSEREHVDVVLAVDLAKTVNTSGLWCH